MGPLHATSSPASHPSLLFILATMHLEMFTYDKRECLYLHDSNQFSNLDFELLAKYSFRSITDEPLSPHSQGINNGDNIRGEEAYIFHW
jgi:hypothetical protein